jgi:hypothetical protein
MSTATPTASSADTTATATIVAIDLGKYKSVACLYRAPAPTRHLNTGVGARLGY